MTEYDKQALDFLTLTNTTIQARWLRHGPYFDDKASRDIWEIKITRGNREYIFTFGSSLQDHENWRAEIAKKGIPYTRADGTKSHRRITWQYSIIPNSEEMAQAMNTVGKMESDFSKVGTGHRPTAYAILACLTKYEPENNVDDFANEFGYTKPSQAIRAYEAVKKEWQIIQALFTDAEIEQLAEIN